MQPQFDLGDHRQQYGTAMAAHDALGVTRGARRVHQRPGIGQRNGLIRLAGAAGREEILIVAIARGTGLGAEMDEAVGFDRQRGADFLDDAGELVLNDEGRRLRIVHDELDFLADQAKVDRQRNQAGLGSRRENLAPLNAVVGEDRDAVTLGEAKAEQGVGEPARTLVPLCDCHRAVEIACADTLRREPRVHRKHFSEIQQIFHVPLLGFKDTGLQFVQCSSPIEIQGTAAMMMVPINSASM